MFRTWSLKIQINVMTTKPRPATRNAPRRSARPDRMFIRAKIAACARINSTKITFAVVVWLLPTATCVSRGAGVHGPTT